MTTQFKIHFLLLILVLFSCVEHRIFIQLHPDGQTYFKFESRGDSTDIFDQDFVHPHNFPDWVNNSKLLDDDEKNNWLFVTEGIHRDSAILFFPDDEISLGYSFSRSATKTWFSTEYTFLLDIKGRKIKEVYPKLYEAILSENPDSLYWLPQALTVLMEKGLNDLSQDSSSNNQSILNQRLVNHLRNSFARISTLDDLKKIQENRIDFLKELLKPFNIDSEFPRKLALAMETHEKLLKSTIDLNDDSFILKVLMPGQTVVTNATETNVDTLIWKFGLDSLLTQHYFLNAKSVIYTTERFQKTLISVGILFLFLMGILIKRRL